MNLENFYVEHCGINGENEVSFTWEDGEYTFFVWVEYEIDYYEESVFIYKVLKSEYWSEIHPISKFTLSDTMLMYLDEELNTFAQGHREAFRIDELVHQHFNDLGI